MVKLGSWKTWFPVSERNFFGANIWLPARIIDGTVLYPGQTFEWWRAIGTVSAGPWLRTRRLHRGRPYGADRRPRRRDVLELDDAVQRRAARRAADGRALEPPLLHQPLSARPGRDRVEDARGGSQTVTFTNDMRTPIVIRTFRYRASGKGWVRYEIWGIPDGRTVSIGKPVVTDFRKATTQTVLVTTLKHGVRNQTEFPSDGMNVAVSRVVRDRNGNVMHRETYTSAYTLWNGRIEIGR